MGTWALPQTVRQAKELQKLALSKNQWVNNIY
jgi:hypothetical protein